MLFSFMVSSTLLISSLTFCWNNSSVTSDSTTFVFLTLRLLFYDSLCFFCMASQSFWNLMALSFRDALSPSLLSSSSIEFSLWAAALILWAPFSLFRRIRSEIYRSRWSSRVLLVTTLSEEFYATTYVSFEELSFIGALQVGHNALCSIQVRKHYKWNICPQFIFLHEVISSRQIMHVVFTPCLEASVEKSTSGSRLSCFTRVLDLMKSWTDL